MHESNIQSLPLVARGKVRDIYRVDAERLLLVTTDRLSAFDVILPDPIPEKGKILTAVSNFWFGQMGDLIPNHLTGVAPEDVVAPDEVDEVRGRAVVVRALKPLPVEAIVRGYLIGSGWKDYQATGQLCGISLPAGLSQAAELAEPIFTPSTKAEVGGHDENISYAEVEALIGADLAGQVRDVAIAIYSRARAFARERGIIIADTKFEFGLDDAGALHLIDEVLTPDSSRFWPADEYREGMSPPSFDKQFVRDYLETLDWNKTPPGPHLPPEILSQTAARYREALTRLVG